MGPISPRGPGGPRGPCSPRAPNGPIGPALPAGPSGPCGVVNVLSMDVRKNIFEIKKLYEVHCKNRTYPFSNLSSVSWRSLSTLKKPFSNHE